MPSPKNTQLTAAPSDPSRTAIEMVWVEGGSYKMQDKLDLSLQSFCMGRYPVTQAEWREIMGENPSRFRGNRRPVERVSWDDIRGEQGFLDRLNRSQVRENTLKALKQDASPEFLTWLKKNPQENLVFRLPSEAEWEYAARGGQRGLPDQYRYAGSNDLNEVGWYHGNSHQETKEVGQKAPNALGLYDMSGNVWEWSEDGQKSEPNPAPVNNQAPFRVIRGGSWGNSPGNCRVSYRTGYWPDRRYDFLGLRLVLGLQF